MTARAESIKDSTPPSQTLDRGLTILEYVATATGGRSLAELAEHLGVHKSVAYRLARTLEHHQLIRLTSARRYEPALQLARLGEHAYRPLRTAAAPQMEKLALSLEMTVYVVVREHEEMVTIAIEEPASKVIAYQPGLRQPMNAGAPAYAWRAAGPEARDEPRAVAEAREYGYARSQGEIIPGLSGIATPILTPDGERVAVLAVVYINPDVDPGVVGRRLMVAAHLIGEELG